MDTDAPEFLHRDESRKIIGCAMEVLNEIGHGFHEKPYENALVIECRQNGIPVFQQRIFDIVYKGEKIGEYIPDLIVFEKMVVDTKVIDKITNHEIGQMMNYLKVTGLRVGLLLNFKNPKLEWKRVAL